MPDTTKKPHPARVIFLEGRGDLPMVEITTAWSTAEIYLHGAHVTNFKRHNELPLLFLSQCSRFQEGQPIRGGVPVIFPWFGPREGLPMHGFARIKSWELKEMVPSLDGTVCLRFQLPDVPEAATYPEFCAEYVVTINDSLTLELIVTNKSADAKLEFEACLHTYFAVEDIASTSVAGLKGVSYLEKPRPMTPSASTPKSTAFTWTPPGPWKFAMRNCIEPFAWKNKTPPPLSSGIPGSPKPSRCPISAMRNIKTWSAWNLASEREPDRSVARRDF